MHWTHFDPDFSAYAECVIAIGDVMEEHAAASSVHSDEEPVSAAPATLRRMSDGFPAQDRKVMTWVEADATVRTHHERLNSFAQNA